MTRHRRLATGLLIVLASAALSLPLASAANADDVGARPSVTVGGEYSHPNISNSSLVGWLLNNNYDQKGFLLSESQGEGIITLYWKKLSVEDQASVLAKAREFGVEVTFKPAKYSAAEFTSAQANAVAKAQQYKSLGFEVSGTTGLSAADAAAGAGITLKGTFTQGKSRSDLVASIKRASTEAGGIPIDAIIEGSTVAARTTRVTDVPGFNGGGLMARPGGGICSSGFSVSVNGIGHTTTARHCESTSWVADQLTTSVYTTATGSTSADGGARALTGAGSAYMFIGAWNDSNGPRLLTRDFDDLSIGDYVCTSGGNSGQHCGLRVSKMLVWWNDGYGGFNNIQADEPSGGLAVVAGDSGGPVFTSNGSGYAWAAGMIQASTNTITCPSGAARYLPNTCASSVLFTSMRTITQYTAGWTLRIG